MLCHGFESLSLKLWLHPPKSKWGKKQVYHHPCGRLCDAKFRCGEQWVGTRNFRICLQLSLLHIYYINLGPEAVDCNEIIWYLSLVSLLMFIVHLWGESVRRNDQKFDLRLRARLRVENVYFTLLGTISCGPPRKAPWCLGMCWRKFIAGCNNITRTRRRLFART